MSVKAAAGVSGTRRLTFTGGGRLSTPHDYAFQEANHFESYKQIIDYIQEIRWEAGRLYVRSRAYGYEAKMWLRITTAADSVIHFEIVEGTLKGAQGELKFISVGPQLTEISLQGSYDYARFPIPRLFAEFGIEVILQKMAIHIRQFLEENYRKKVR